MITSIHCDTKDCANVDSHFTGDIIARFEKRGYKLVGLKMVWPTMEMAQTHYKDLSKKPFFSSLCKFFSVSY